MNITPPHNIEAEQSFLGGIIHRGHLPPEVEMRAEWFYRSAHRTMFEIFQKMDAQGQEIDPVTLVDALKAGNKLEQVGGAAYVALLVERVPSLSTESIANYARIVREKSVRRATVSLLQNGIASVIDEEQGIEEVIAQISSDMANIEYSGASNRFKDMRTLVREGIRRIEARSSQPNYVSGVPTPFKNLNQLTNGFQPSDLIILAGRPSMGKSAIAQQIVQWVAEQAGPVAFFSLEMDADSLMERSFASCARIPSQKLRSGHLGTADWPRLTRAASELADLPILTNDMPSLTAEQIRFLARQAKARMDGLSLIVIDYLQLIRSDRKNQQRYLEVGEVTRTLKCLARELDTPVLLLSQLNRSCESREDKRPLLSDLRESGDIEQDADVVMFIYRDEYYCSLCSKGRKSDCKSGHANIAEILIRKHRKGPTGSMTLVWQEQFTRFEDRAYE